MQYHCKDLEWQLQSVDKHPIFSVSELLLGLRHSHSHYEHGEESKVYYNIRRGAKAFVHQLGWNRLIEYLAGCARENSTGETKEHSSKAHRVKVKD